MESLGKTGKTYLITFSGGEPFLQDNILELCEALSSKHYISFNTNLICESVMGLAERIDPRKVGFIYASLHIEELQKKNLVDRFVEHFLFLKAKKFSIKAYIVGYPPIINKAEEYRKFFSQKGVDFKFNKFIGDFNGKRYPQAYTKEEIEKLHLKDRAGRWRDEQKGICNAGYNVGAVLLNGDIIPCFGRGQEVLGNIYTGFSFKKRLRKCPSKACQCVAKEKNKFLFYKALRENYFLPPLLRKPYRLSNIPLDVSG